MPFAFRFYRQAEVLRPMACRSRRSLRPGYYTSITRHTEDHDLFSGSDVHRMLNMTAAGYRTERLPTTANHCGDDFVDMIFSS
jgi:hypothetical protein